MKRKIRRRRRLRLIILSVIPAVALWALGVWGICRYTGMFEGSAGRREFRVPVLDVSAAMPETSPEILSKDPVDAIQEGLPDVVPEAPADASLQAPINVAAQPEPDLAADAKISSAGVEYSSKAGDILANMTLREKVCQMMLVAPSAITGVSQVTSAGETTRAALEKYPVGGLFYNKSNMVSKQQVAQMLANSQSYSRVPLILTCDEEGGRVARLMNTVGTTWVDAMLHYKDDGPDVACANAMTIAQDMSALGFNMDLAPVADVWSNPENTVIGDRAYSDDFDQAASLLPAAVKGFQTGGVACVIKHFPGHGNSSEDSHYGSVYIYKTLDQLRAQELRPFQAAIDAGADAVMMGHLIVQDVSGEPAVFSYEMVTQLLRGEMGFQGVVMTDALNMQAISDHYTSAQVAVKAVQAGVDILLCPMDLDSTIDALVSAVEGGEISEGRIDESVLRILRLKENRGIL